MYMIMDRLFLDCYRGGGGGGGEVDTQQAVIGSQLLFRMAV